MPDMISAKQLRERLRDVVEKRETRAAIYCSVPQSARIRYRARWRSVH